MKVSHLLLNVWNLIRKCKVTIVYRIIFNSTNLLSIMLRYREKLNYSTFFSDILQYKSNCFVTVSYLEYYYQCCSRALYLRLCGDFTMFKKRVQY